jgi:hypothetical protein
LSLKLNTTITVIGTDIGKNAFHIVDLNQRGAIVLRQKWSRGKWKRAPGAAACGSLARASMRGARLARVAVLKVPRVPSAWACPTPVLPLVAGGFESVGLQGFGSYKPESQAPEASKGGPINKAADIERE